MIVRFLAVTATALTLTACAAETSSDENVGKVEEGTIDTNACPIRGGCVWAPPPPLVVDPDFPDFYCSGTGPNGGRLFLQNGKCYEEIIRPGSCDPGYFICPPSRFISVYNPCYYPTPYYRCNVYGDCWCSSYP